LKKEYKRLVPVLVMSFMMIFIIAGCGSKLSTNDMNSSKVEFNENYNTSDKGESKEQASYENEITSNEVSGKGTGTDLREKGVQSKVIVYKTIDLETLKFDEVKNKILERVEIYGGYIQNSQITGRGVNEKEYYSHRRANLVLRIPKDKLKNFENDVNQLDCSITNTNLSTEDVTMQYFDNEAHLKSLKIQEERLLELLKKSGELKDILEVERELQDVRYQIERLTGTLRKLDNLVDYSTITINIYEVQEIREVPEKPVTLGEKIANAFKVSIKYLEKFFKGILIVIAAVLPFVIVFGLIGFVVYKILNKVKNKNRDRDRK
jgi:uncharacterized protein DUF4349